MSEPTNSDRAARARSVLEVYGGVILDVDQDDREQAVDLVTDLMHLLGEGEVRSIVDTASGHYGAERATSARPSRSVIICDTCGHGDDLHTMPGAMCAASGCPCSEFEGEVLS